MNLDLFKNIAEQIKKDNNVKEFMQDLSKSLETPINPKSCKKIGKKDIYI